MTGLRRAALFLSLCTTSACLCGVPATPGASLDGGDDAGALSSSLDAGTPDAGTLDAGPADAGPADAGTLDAGPTACVVEIVATSPQCRQECDVHLFLPGGQRFCTVTCATTEDCAPFGATLICPSEVGVCMLPCGADAECLAGGFPRCHPVGAFCDTLPACTSNQLCLDNGLTTCVMPGHYCQ